MSPRRKNPERPRRASAKKKVAGGKVDRRFAAVELRMKTLRRASKADAKQGRRTLPDALDELQNTLEELQVAEEELRQQNEELAASQQAIIEERRRYQELFEFAPDGYVVTDLHANIREANRTAGTLLGVRPDLLVKKPLIVFVAEEDRKAFRARLFDLAREKKPARFDLCLKRRSGPAFWAAFLASIVIEQGKPASARWMFRDVTERKRAQEALRKTHDALGIRLKERTTDLAFAAEELTAEILRREQAEAHIRDLAKFPAENPYPVLRIAKDGTLLYANAASDSLLEEWNCTVGKVCQEAMEKLAKGALETGSRHETEIEHRGRILVFHSVPLKDAGYVNLYGRDVTARRQAERSILRAKEEWERTFHAVPDLIAILDKDHRIVRVNQAMAERLGVTPEECVGRKCYEGVHGLSHPLVFCPHSLTCRDGKEHVAEVHEDRLGGDFLVSTTPLVDEKGRSIGTVHVARDITERKKREEELRRLNRTLSALGHSNEAFLRARTEAEFLNEACRIIVEDCGHAMVWIGYAETDEGKTVRPIACAGFEAGYLESLNVTWADTERGRGPTGTAIRTGKPCACTNMLTDPKFAPWREQAVKRGYASSMVLPLLAGGNAFGAVSIYFKQAGSLSEDETKLLTELADDIAWGVTSIRLREAKARAEEALSESETRYRTLFETMSEGFALCEILCDAQGKPCDFRYLAVNPAFQQQTGLKAADIVGRTVMELFPQTEPIWIERYGKAALTGEPAHFEAWFAPLERWFDVSVYRTEPGRFAVVFVDVTERRRAEDEIKRNDARLAGLLRMSQHQAGSIQELLDFALSEAIALTGSKIGYIYFYDETRKEFTLNTWSRDVMEQCTIIEPQTTYQLDKTGIWGEAVRQARPVIVNDFHAPHPLKKGYPEGHAPLHKFLTVPILVEGHIVGVVGVANKETDYDGSDVRQLTLLMDAAWKITERKRAEDSLREAKEGLELAVRERTADLVKTVDLLQTEVAERRRAEWELRQSETRLAEAQGIAHVGNWDWDLVNNRIHWSDEMYRIFGFEPRQFEPTYEAFTERVHPEDRQRVKRDADQAIAGKKPYAHEYRVVRPDGAVRVIQAQGDVTRDSGGKPIRLAGVIQDITERKRAEEAVRAASLYARSLLEASLDPLVTISPAGKITDVNRATEVATGVSREHLIGSDFSDYFTEPEKARRGYQEVLSEGLVRDYPLTLRHASGRTIDVLYHATVYRDERGEAVGVFAAARDVTERELIHKALEASESRYRALMEEAVEGILVADAGGRILEVNPSFCRILGYQPADILGTSFARYIGEEDLARRPLSFDALRPGETVVIDREVRRKDGELIDVEGTAKRLQDGRVQVLCHDVTSRKEAQEKLRAYQARLKSMATELSLVEERQRRQIAGDLHDRIGQTLAVSKLKLGLLKEQISDPKVSAALKEVHDLVSQTLEDARTLMFELCPPVLYDLGLEPALEYVLDEFRKRNPDVEVVFEDDGQSKPLDDNVRAVLFRAARELLQNIAKHARPTRVRLAVRRVDSSIELTLEDDGAGFDASVMRVGAHPEGGFGLFSIREQLAYLGGFFVIHSTPGRVPRATLTADLAENNDSAERKSP